MAVTKGKPKESEGGQVKPSRRGPHFLDGGLLGARQVFFG